jgi:hypothetical protein
MFLKCDLDHLNCIMSHDPKENLGHDRDLVTINNIRRAAQLTPIRADFHDING